MEHGADAHLPQRRDELRTYLDRREQQVIHMRIVAAFRRHYRSLEQALGLKWCSPFVVTVPDGKAPCGDLAGLLQLGGEERGNDLAWEIGRTHVHPGVLVHLSAKELAAVGALLANDLGALRHGWIVDQQRTTFAG